MIVGCTPPDIGSCVKLPAYSTCCMWMAACLQNTTCGTADLLAGNLLRERIAREVPQAQLARACGLPTSDIGDIDRAALNVTLTTLEVLTVGLACAPADRLTLIHPPTAPASSRAPAGNRTSASAGVDFDWSGRRDLNSGPLALHAMLC